MISLGGIYPPQLNLEQECRISSTSLTGLMQAFGSCCGFWGYFSVHLKEYCLVWRRRLPEHRLDSVCWILITHIERQSNERINHMGRSLMKSQCRGEAGFVFHQQYINVFYNCTIWAEQLWHSHLQLLYWGGNEHLMWFQRTAKNIPLFKVNLDQVLLWHPITVLDVLLLTRVQQC